MIFKQLAQPIRLLLKYNKVEFDDTRYEQGDGELNARAYTNTAQSTVGSHTINIRLTTVCSS